MPRSIKIESGIPLPPDGRGLRGRAAEYPWQKMKVGQSFLVPDGISIANFRRQAWDAGRKFDRKFSVRKVGKQFRCWRVL